MLILVRHGQTVANAESRLVGRLDSPLTALGRAQAVEVARAVLESTERVDRIVASPLRRARDTAAAFVEVSNGVWRGSAPDVTEVEIDERWIELDYGEFDGRHLADVPGQLWASWKVDASYVPGGGESLAALGARVRSACDELAVAASEGNVVVVSHVSPIKAAVAWALAVGDVTAWRMHLATASISRVATGSAGPSLHTFNETSHLARVPPSG